MAIVGTGTFAVARMAGDDEAGGAATPEEAGLAFFEALGNEDLLGMVEVMLPGERDALRGPITDIVEELTRLEVLSDEADAAAVTGVDFVVENASVVEETDQRRRHRQPGDACGRHRLDRRRRAARR